MAVPASTEPGYNTGFLTDEEVDARREEFGFVRAYDGHVAIRNKKTNEFWDLKLDLKSPGTLLLRNPGSGQVYVLAFSSLKQIDLSDDDILAVVSADEWEDSALPLQGDNAGVLQKLEMTREGFYSLVSVMEP